MIDTITTTYEFIQDLLKEDYRLEKIIAVGARGRRQIGIRFHVNSILKDVHLGYMKETFKDMELNIYYDKNSEYIYIEIPE